MKKTLEKLVVLLAVTVFMAGWALPVQARVVTDINEPYMQAYFQRLLKIEADGGVFEPHKALKSHPDFNVSLLKEAAEKYKDPNDIAAIPDEVIIEDFINIAFSDHDWASDYPWYDGKEKPICGFNGCDGANWFEHENIGAEYLIAGQFYSRYENRISPPEKPRALNRINKIVRETPYIVDYLERLGMFHGAFGRSGEAAEYKKFMSEFLDTLSKETGIRFLPYYDFSSRDDVISIFNDWPFFEDVNYFRFRETPADLAKWSELCLKDFQRTDFHEWDGFCSWAPLYVRHAFKTTTRFTPRALAQVEGYFSSDSYNRITAGECFIANPISLPLRLSLVSECMIRQLGLPDTSFLFGNALLSVRGPSAMFPVENLPVVPAGVAASSIPAKYVYVGRGINGRRAFDAYAGYDRLKLTAYDRLMVHILYDERIKPGMTVAQARAVLPQILKDIRQH